MTSGPRPFHIPEPKKQDNYSSESTNNANDNAPDRSPAGDSQDRAGGMKGEAESSTPSRNNVEKE